MSKHGLLILLIFVIAAGCTRRSTNTPGVPVTYNLSRITVADPGSNTGYPNDTLRYTVTAFLTNDSLTDDSTVVEWYCQPMGIMPMSDTSGGVGRWAAPVSFTTRGASTNAFLMRDGIGEDTVFVKVFHRGRTDTVRQNWVITHIPRVPAHVSLYPRSVTIPRNTAPATVAAVVTDSTGHSIPYSYVSWGCTSGMGTITSNGFSVSGDTAYAQLTAGLLTGNYQYWATAVTGISDTAVFVVEAQVARVVMSMIPEHPVSRDTVMFRLAFQDTRNQPVSVSGNIAWLCFPFLTSVGQWASSYTQANDSVATNRYFMRTGVGTDSLVMLITISRPENNFFLLTKIIAH